MGVLKKEQKLDHTTPLLSPYRAGPAVASPRGAMRVYTCVCQKTRGRDSLSKRHSLGGTPSPSPSQSSPGGTLHQRDHSP